MKFTVTATDARKIARYMPAVETRDLINARAKDAGKDGIVEFNVEPGFAGGSIHLRHAALRAGVKLTRV